MAKFARVRADSSFALGEKLVTVSAAIRKSCHDQVDTSSRGLLFQLGRNGCDSRTDLLGNRLRAEFARIRAGTPLSTWGERLRLAQRSNRRSPWI